MRNLSPGGWKAKVAAVLCLTVWIESFGPGAYEAVAQVVHSEVGRAASPLLPVQAGPIGSGQATSSLLTSGSLQISVASLQTLHPAPVLPALPAAAAAHRPLALPIQAATAAPEARAELPSAPAAKAQDLAQGLAKTAEVAAQLTLHPANPTLDKETARTGFEAASAMSPDAASPVAAAFQGWTSGPRLSALHAPADAAAELTPAPQAQEQQDAQAEAKASFWRRSLDWLAEQGRMLRILVLGAKDGQEQMQPYKGKMRSLRGSLVLAAALAFGLDLAIDPLMSVAAAGPSWKLALVTAGILAGAVAGIVNERFSVYWERWLGIFYVADYRKALSRKLLSLGLTFHGRNESGVLANYLKTTTNYLSELVVDVPAGVTRAGMTTLLSVAGLLWFFPLWGALILGLLPVLSLISGYYGQKIGELEFEVTDQEATLLDRTRACLNAIATIKSFGAEAAADGAYRQLTSELRDKEVAIGRLSANWSALASVIDVFMEFGLTLLGAWLFALGTLSFGQLLIFGMLSAGVYSGFSELARQFMAVRTNHEASAELRELMAQKPDIKDSAAAKPLAGQVAGSISFRGVSFAFPAAEPDGAQTRIFSDLSFDIPAGKTAAFVGPSGSGKSTLVGLLTRLYERQGGQISVAGQAIEDISLDSLHANIAVVPQDASRLFNTTILHNIAYGKPDATQEEIDRAVRLASVDSFAYDRHRFPDGLHTTLAEGGKNLSGGQRQLIALARAVLLRAPILVLDETTAALDPNSERMVEAAIRKAVKEDPDWHPTVVKIAHRLSTVRDSDVIFYLDRGAVQEQGTWDELIKKDGLFASQVKANSAASRKRKTEAAPQAEEKPAATAKAQYAVAAAFAGAAAALLSAGVWSAVALGALACLPFFAVALAAGAAAASYGLTGARLRSALEQHLSDIEAAGERGPSALLGPAAYLSAAERKSLAAGLDAALTRILGRIGRADQKEKYSSFLHWLDRPTSVGLTGLTRNYRLLTETESKALADALGQALAESGLQASWEQAQESLEAASPQALTTAVAHPDDIGRLNAAVGQRVARGQVASAFSQLASPYRAAVTAHEAAHSRGAGEARALLAQLPEAWAILRHELKALGAQVAELILGDRETRPFLKKYSPQMRRATLLMLVEAVLMTLAGVLGGTLVDVAGELLAGKAVVTLFGLAALSPFSALVVLTVVTAALILPMPLLARQIEWYRDFLNANLAKDLRDNLHSRMARREMSFWTQRGEQGREQNTSTSVASRITDDMKTLAAKNAAVRIPLLTDGVKFLMSTVFLFAMNPIVAVIVLVTIPVLAGISGKFGNRLETISERFGKVRADLARLAQEIFSNIRLVKLFNTEAREAGRYAAAADELAELGAQEAAIGAKQHILENSVSELFTSYGIYLVGAWLLALGIGLPGLIVSTVALSEILMEALSGLSNNWLEFKTHSGETVVGRRWMREQSRIQQRPQAQDLGSVRGEIAFDHVSMSFEAPEEAAPAPDAAARMRFAREFARLYRLELLGPDGGLRKDLKTGRKWDKAPIENALRDIVNRVIDALDIEKVTEELLLPVEAALREIQAQTGLSRLYLGLLTNGLKDVSFKIQPGERVAFVGGIGSGKSTIFRVLQRQWDAQGGAVTLDGHDVKDATLPSLARQFAVASQETDILEGTIGENLLFGNEGATPEQVWEAVRIAKADSFLKQDPKGNEKGLDSSAGEDGRALSGGQVQRLGVARALLRVMRGSRILLLDEPTSKLDAQNEASLMEGVSEFAKRRNVPMLVIAHRLSTVMGFDKVVVLDKGRIVEVGSPAQLLEKKDGAFYELWQAGQKD